jgi:DNA topoisomerase I
LAARNQACDASSTLKQNNGVAAFEAAVDPVVAAKLAKLRHVSDDMPGIMRHKARNGFDYRFPDGQLRRRGLPRERVLAAVVRLMETTLFRIGNTEYAKANKSYGLTTLRDRHVEIEGSRIHLSFRGKHGIRHETDIKGRRLARIVKDCRDLPGYELFQYVDEEGHRHTIDSADVNDYLREISGEEITAKDFRTWAATNLAALALQESELFDTEAKRKRAVEKVAKHLGNTPTICRRCYIHPAIFDGYLDGTLLITLKDHTQAYLAENVVGMSPKEAAVAAFLRLRLGELEKQQEASSPVGNQKNGRSPERGSRGVATRRRNGKR